MLSKTTKVLGQEFGENWVLYHGDCVEVTRGLPESSIHLSCFSPPFSNLYIYGDSDRDLGNAATDEWAYHSKVTIWKDPVIEMQRTKAHGLLYKQLRADSTFSRQGLPEYLLMFRKWPQDEHEEAHIEPVTHTHEDFPLEIWQRYASPVWFDIRQTRVLNVEQARESQDEKHICLARGSLVLNRRDICRRTRLDPHGAMASGHS